MEKSQLSDSGHDKFSGSSLPWTRLCLIGVNTFDVAVDKDRPMRWKATSSDITKDDFTWNYDSWFDIVKYSLGCSYIALQ